MSEDENAPHFHAAHRTQSIYRLPPDARQILMVRHGSSVGETTDTIEVGDLVISDPDLSPEGYAQAEALGGFLSNETIGAIFVTPLKRTQLTAAPLARRLALEPVVVEALREVHLGDWEHIFYERAKAGDPLVARLFAEETWEVVPNAERMADFRARVNRGIIAICEAIPAGSTAAAFSHAGTIAEACRRATDSRAFAFTAPDNTSVSRLVILADGSWKLRSYNELAHLGYGGKAS